MSNWTEKARKCGCHTVEYFKDQIAEQLVQNGQASDDLFSDYPGGDSYHHERHIDRSYLLTEAAELLEELSSETETDSGLWPELEPQTAVSCQAAFTFGNAVYSEWRSLIEWINEAYREKQEELEDDPVFVSLQEASEEDKAARKPLHDFLKEHNALPEAIIEATILEYR